MNRAIKIIKKLNRKKSRRTRKNKTVINVNTPPPLPPKPKKYLNKKKNSPPPKMMSLNPVSQYKMALLNPFDARCTGVRVPDAGAFSTQPFHFRSEILLTTSTSYTQSGLAFLPSIFWTAYTDGQLGFSWNTTTAFPQNTSNYYYVTPTSLAYTTYRPVAGGITISCQIPELYATGRVIISPVPLTGNAVGFETLSTVTAGSPSTPLQVISGGVIPTPGLLTYSSAYKVALIDLIRKPLVIPFQVEQPTLAYKLKSAFAGAATWSAGYNLVEPGEAANTSGSIFAGSTSSTDTALDFSGWNAIYLVFEGIPLTSTYNGDRKSVV